MSQRNQVPPKWIDKLLGILIHTRYQEEIFGDLKERFDLRVEKAGLGKARWAYMKEAISYMRPRNIFGGRYRSLLLSDVLFNNLKLSIRNIRRGGAFSTINIFGLVLGLTTSKS